MLQRWITRVLAALALSITLSMPAVAQDEPFNRIVIIIDSSGSYQNRQAEAIAMADRLLRGVADRPRRHWQASDEVRIVALDALPETVWTGRAESLGTANPGVWSQRFAGRGDFAHCTDVKAALERAVLELHAAPAPTGRYLFVFSDLVSEPPAGALRRCGPPQATLGDAFEYASLSDIHIAAFWLPAEQKWAWDTALRAHGLSAFRLYSDSESAVLEELDIPPPAVRVTTPAEREMAINRLKSIGGRVVAITATIIVVTVLAVLVLAALRRRGPSRRRGALAGAPLRTRNGGRQ